MVGPIVEEWSDQLFERINRQARTCYRHRVSRTAFVALLVAGCAVDPSGIPGRGDSAVSDGAVDFSVPDGPVTPDLGRDQGVPDDLGPEDDMAMADDLGLDMGPPDMAPPDMGPPDMGPPDLGPPDMGPPDLGPPDMFIDGGCGMAETCNGADDCDGAIDENPGGDRGENICDGCTREVFGGKTYQVCPFSVTWDEALGLCQSFGYELAALETRAEDAFIDSSLVGGDDYWIGLNDRDAEGDFEWEDSRGDRPLGSFTDWDTSNGEPNNAPGGDGDCVRISRDDGDRWRDDDCDTNGIADFFQAENDYVCESR